MSADELDTTGPSTRNEYDDLRQLTSDLETLAYWKEDLAARICRVELCFQSSVGILEEQRDRLLREGDAWKRACNSIMKRLRGGRL
jgi:hypothetical protein